MSIAATLALALTLVLTPGAVASDGARVAAVPLDTQASAPVAAPAAPVVVSAQGAGRGVSAEWLPPDPADAVTEYEVVATPVTGTETTDCPAPLAQSITVPASATNATVPGLCPLVAYTVTIRASSDAGAGQWSLDSDPAAALETQRPSPPVVTQALGRDGSIHVWWSGAAYNGGETLSGYQVTVSHADGAEAVSALVGAGETTYATTGLTNDAEYAVSIEAVNSAGSSIAAEVVIVPSAAYVPSAPTNVTIIPDTYDGITVSWGQPIDDGGAPVMSYEVSYQRAELLDGAWIPAPAAPLHTATTSQSNVVVTDFEDLDESYLFTVKARNAVGTGDGATGSSAVTPRVEITSATVVLEPETVAEIDSVVGSALVWEPAAPDQAKGLGVGDVLVAPASDKLPNGLLREVVAVDTPGDAVVVTTEEASIDQVFDHLTFSADLDPLAQGDGDVGAVASRGTELRPATSGVSVTRSRAGAGITRSDSAVFALEKDLGSTTLSGQLSVTSSMSLGLSVDSDWLFGDKHVRVDAEATIDANATVEVSMSGEKSWRLTTIPGPSTTFMVGLVPVVVQVKVPVSIELSGEVSITTSATATIGAGATWDSRNPSTLETRDLSSPLTVSGDAPDGFSVTGSGFVGLKVQAIAALYGAGGPSVSATVGISANVNFRPAPGDVFLRLTPGLSLKAGLAFDFFGVSGDLEVPVGEWTWDDFLILKAPTPMYTVDAAAEYVAAGSSVAMTAERSDGEEQPLFWSVDGGVAGDVISPSGVFMPVGPEPRDVTVQVSDFEGIVGKTTVRVGYPFDAPMGLQLDNPASESLNIEATWKAPAQTGGAPLAEYVITTVPDTGTHTQSAYATDFTIEGVAPGHYSVEVYARNENGRLSPSATNSIYVAQQCTATFTGDGDGSSWDDPDNWESGVLPANGSWVCVSRQDITVPAGVTAQVAGLILSGAEVTVNGTLDVSTFMLAELTDFSGDGTLVAGKSVTLSLSGDLGIDLVNEGTVTVRRGGLALVGSTLTNKGSLRLVEGANIGRKTSATSSVVNHGVMTLNSGAGSDVALPLVNYGNFIVGSSDEVEDVVNHGTLTVIKGAEPVTINTLNIASGKILGNGEIYMPPFAQLIVPADGATLGPIGGGYTLAGAEVTGGTLTIPAGLNLRTTAYFSGTDFEADVVNRGSINLSGGGITLADSTLTNYGTVTFSDGADLNPWGGTRGFVVNHGLIKVEPGSGTRIFPEVANYGTISVGSGDEVNELVNHGTLTVGAGPEPVAIKSLSLGGGKITGDGELHIQPSGALIAPTGGAVLGPLKGGYTLSGVTLSGGALTIPEGVELRTDTYFASSYFDVDIINNGSIELAGGGALLRGMKLTNLGSLTLLDGADVSYPSSAASSIDNLGSVKINSGTGSRIAVPVVNHGDLTAGADNRIDELVNRGTLTLAAGERPIVVGTLTLEDESLARVDLTSVSDFATAPIRVSGALSTGGELAVVAAGDYRPVHEDTVALFAAKSTSGEFAGLTWSPELGGEWALVQTSTGVAAAYDLPLAPTEYSVTFDSAGGSGVAPQTVVDAARAVEPAAPTREGYTFNEWLLGDTAYDFDAAVTGDVELTASWKINSYTVAFNSAGGSKVADQTIEHNKKGNKPVNPTRPGYTFEGWKLDATLYDFTTPVTSDITLTASWKAVPKQEPEPKPKPEPEPKPQPKPGPPPVGKPANLVDVSSNKSSKNYTQFHTQIQWLANTGITKGWNVGGGKHEFRAKEEITREAMAAFMYRYAGSPAVKLPSRSPFRDVTPQNTNFYKEIIWMNQQGISTGWAVGNAKEFRPKDNITRDAMAAFMYRFADKPSTTPPRVSPFSDVTPSTQFYREITWLSNAGISTGWTQSKGKPQYRPYDQISREAMAAFLYRFDRL